MLTTLELGHAHVVFAAKPSSPPPSPLSRLRFGTPNQTVERRRSTLQRREPAERAWQVANRFGTTRKRENGRSGWLSASCITPRSGRRLRTAEKLPVHDSLQARSTFSKTGNGLSGNGIAICSPFRCRSSEPNLREQMGGKLTGIERR